jgi:hypothetical protein
VVIIVDASSLSFEAHNEVWKGDREHVRNTIIGERYQDAVRAAIKTSQPLIDLHNEVAREELEQAAKTERNDLFQKLVQSDPNLAGLLTNKDPVITPPSRGAGGNGDDTAAKEFEGRDSPTFLKFEDKARETGVTLPIKRTRPVAARTDAENGYLQRGENKGTLVVDPTIYARFGLNSQLHNGRLTIYLDPVPGAVKVGDEITFKVGLQDHSMPHPVEDQIVVRIIEETAPSKPNKKTKTKAKRDAGDNGDKEGTGKPAPTHGLPPYRLLTEDGRKVADLESLPWPEGFNEYDGGSIEDLGEQGVLYKINYDNVYHLKYRRTARGDLGRDVVTEKYILGMRIMLMGYEHALQTLKAAKNGDGAATLAEFQDDFRRMAARGAASTVLALASDCQILSPPVERRAAKTLSSTHR